MLQAPGPQPASAPAPSPGVETVTPLPPVVSSVSEQVDPFSAIEACLPFNIAIAPGGPDNYTVVAVAEDPVLDSINVLVDNGTLQISTDGDFNTTGSVELAVWLPFCESFWRISCLENFIVIILTIKSVLMIFFRFGLLLRLGKGRLLVLAQVFLPADQLEAVTVSSVGEVTILPGFSSPSFTLSSAFGSGDINVIGFDTEALTIETAG